ncbi:receptor-type tyrosine-protein phosphatase eta-like isoform X1 [Alosa alosa]|uniref:receptor-type tyrosine-protein phosphatase eta-like isoform X1 n=1 Tax=Alosa alosa TaxID=278164 RepID=UPI0020153494|nr:receptor-type tyrosine-protein phosphatase eta-like isoform X1 [Alosa alosa]
MRRLQSFATVLLKAAILLFATVKVLHTQQCQPCTYKSNRITTRQISIQVAVNAKCDVYNTTFNQTGDSLIINELTPGTKYSFTINCTDVQKCCANFTTQAVNLTVMHINTTSVNVTWTGCPVANASFMFTTRPQVVSNLAASNVTSESVSLIWVKGQGESSFYRVLWEIKGASMTEQKSTGDTFATIAGLVPGTKYNFMVKSVGADNQTEGDVAGLQVITKPGIAENITAVQGNSSLNVSWDKPQGSVSKYVVQLGGQSKSPVSLHVEFENLQAGTVYNCNVTSVLESENSTSDSVELATKPNPPYSVSINNRNNISLTLAWSTPLLMKSGTQLSYVVLYSSSDSSEQVTKNGTSAILSGLHSGTQYSINVTTIGPQNLRSSTVSLAEYTLPNPVMNLRSTSMSTTSVKLEWDSPLDPQSYYRYVAKTVSPTQTNQTVSESSVDITGLQPGTEYNFSVTTTISPSPIVQGQSEYVLGYTKPTTVVNISAVALSTTQICLTWEYPADHKEYYTYEAQIVSGSVQSISTSNKSIVFDNLVPGTNYMFKVITKANNKTSQPVDVSSFTKVGKATGLTAIGTTTSMAVTWDSPTGIVATYVIVICQSQTPIQNVTEVTNQSVVFENLLPGKSYTIKVTTKSGPFQEDSDMVTNATYPNPPRELVVEQFTNSSLSLTWKRPLNMTLGEYNYSVTSTSTSNVTMNNNITMNNLLPGTQYNVTVKTVGPLNYESTAVTISQYTNPNPPSGLEQLRINTGSVTVNWTQSDAKGGYSYQVTAYYPNGTQVKQLLYNETTATIEDLPSGGEYNVTVITRTPGGTQAPAKSIIAFTKPNPITGLVAITQNESTVFLNWTKPIGFPSGGIYYITTNCSDAQPNRTIHVETIYITGLSPGISCFSTVYSQVNNISGDPVSIEYSTKPPKVSPEVKHVGKMGTLYVTWTPVKGVDKYVVSLATAGAPVQTVNISNNESTNHNLSHTFSDLLPATVYKVTITTVSGSFSESSDPVSIATYPTKPGAITIIETTTDSITLAWVSAPNMTNGSFNYAVTYETAGANSSEITTNNITHLLSGLSSGTPYNISVATVGPMDLKSDLVFLYPVTTRPKSVTYLIVSATNTNSITVQWTPPSGFKDGYKYNVSGPKGTPSSTTQSNKFTFTDLSAGSSYNFSVQTLTADNTAGALVYTSGCTDAAEVSPLTCTGPNRTEAILQLTWNNPPGNNIGFEIQLGNSKEQISKCNPTACSHTFSGLSYYTDYTVDIVTRGCGKNSSVKSVSCKTGITVPPTTSTENTVTTADVEYNKFTLQLSTSLFNKTYGPIVAYGILVTSDTGLINGGGASSYLTNTHSDWTARKTSTYLAVVQQFQSDASSAVSERSRRSTGTVTAVIGDETQWQDYVNGPLNAKGSYSYAVVTFTQLEVQNGLISITESYFSITEFHRTPVDLPENPAVIGGAIGGGIAAIVIILIVTMIIVATFKRKKNKEDTPGVPIHSIRNKVSEPIKVEDYEAHYRRQRADSFCGFAQEFEDLKPVGINHPKNHALAPENRTKNRYNNVLPYDNSRVKLSIHGNPFDDYINASNMPGYNSRKEFIAAQGPLPVTVNDFWRMIWEKNVHTVVMLTRCNEQGRVKCEEYWPVGQESKHFTNLIVTTTSEIPLEDWTIRDFDVKNVKTAETRAVRHFHFTAWPDHGVPETTELLINFRHLVREHMDQYSRHSPTMVHCSAGVGRTGTFIAIDRLIFQIERDGVVDIYGIIHDLRMHRTLMVQTEDQYVFLNQCAIDIIRSRTGTNVDLIYQNTAALTIYENFEPMKKSKNGYHKA